jgi:Uma2 family endonuclease
MHVRPDWVLEVLSPGHERRDRLDKWRVLHRAGVPHYWVADPDSKTLEVHRWHRDGFLKALVTVPGETVRAEPFDPCELRVAVLFGDEDDDE